MFNKVQNTPLRRGNIPQNQTFRNIYPLFRVHPKETYYLNKFLFGKHAVSKIFKQEVKNN